MALTWLKALQHVVSTVVVAGVHTGCIDVIAGNNTAIKTVDDLKGKRIGVPAIGSTPFMFLNRVLGAKGWDLEGCGLARFPFLPASTSCSRRGGRGGRFRPPWDNDPRRRQGAEHPEHRLQSAVQGRSTPPGFLTKVLPRIP